MIKLSWFSKYLVISFFIGSVLLTSGCGGEPRLYADPAKAVEVVPGKEFVVNLEANPTTGYSWIESHDETIVRLVDKTLAQNNARPEMVGVGGIEIFRFQALEPGSTTIAFAYKRTSENDVANRMVFNVTVKQAERN